MSTMTARRHADDTWVPSPAYRRSLYRQWLSLSVRRTVLWSVLLLPLWGAAYQTFLLAIGIDMLVLRGEIPTAWLLHAPALALHVWLTWCYQQHRTKRELRKVGARF